MFWNDIHLLISDEDQLVPSPIGKRLSLKFDAVNCLLHWCQVDVPQQMFRCFGIDIKHGDTLPSVNELWLMSGKDTTPMPFS
jgi:hypothetical protein